MAQPPQESQEPQNCAICILELGTGTPHALECSHSFHAECIMTWFRSGHSKCPLCNHSPEWLRSGGDGGDDYSFFPDNVDMNLRILRKRKLTNPTIAQELCRLEKLQNRVKKYKQAYTDILNTRLEDAGRAYGNLKLKKIISTVNKARQALWVSTRKVYRHKRALCRMNPIVPIVLPVSRPGPQVRHGMQLRER